MTWIESAKKQSCTQDQVSQFIWVSSARFDYITWLSSHASIWLSQGGWKSLTNLLHSSALFCPYQQFQTFSSYEAYGLWLLL